MVITWTMVDPVVKRPASCSDTVNRELPVQLTEESAIRASLAMRLGQEETLRRAYASEAYLLAGRIHEARDTALGALEFAEQHGQHEFGARVRLILGNVARLHPSLLADNAEHHYRDALRRADERGMRPLVAHCHLGLGRVYHHCGNTEQARENLRAAITMYHDMDMAYAGLPAHGKMTHNGLRPRLVVAMQQSHAASAENW
jgi:tetratricopeptide (TPR) repeat protein